MAERAHHQLPESWGDKAEDYESLFVPLSGAAATLAIEAVELDHDERFLDIAAGTGAVTLEAIGAGARVVAIDFSEGMLAFLSNKLNRHGVDGVALHQMDGQALEFGDETFDVVGSGFGLVWFPDPAAGLREMHRVLKPGGRAFVTTTGHAGSSDLQNLIMRASAAAGASMTGPVPSLMPGVDGLREMLEAAGFRDVTVTAQSLPWPIPSAREFWAKWALESPPGAARWRGQSESVRRTAGDEFVRLVEETGQSAFPTEVLIGLGRK